MVHADKGDGIVNPQSLSLAQAGDGLYFHLAVEGGKQTTETIPPSRIFETIGKFVTKKATKIVIVNLSDIKPVPAGTAAALSFLWDPAPMMAMPPDVAETRFLTSWCVQQYGVEGGAAVLPVMQSYFNNPYFTGQTSGKWVGEGDLARDNQTCRTNPIARPPGICPPTPAGMHHHFCSPNMPNMPNMQTTPPRVKGWRRSSMLTCAAVCCHVLPCDAVYCRVLTCAAV